MFCNFFYFFGVGSLVGGDVCACLCACCRGLFRSSVCIAMRAVLVATTIFLGAVLSLVGSIKVAGGRIAPSIYAMQLEAITERYQPALTGVPILPETFARWLKELPTRQFMLLIGLPELSCGVIFIASLIINSLRPVARFTNQLMLLHMLGPLTSHALGDDWSLPLDSNVGPTGIAPALVVTFLLAVRLMASTRSVSEKPPTKKN